MSYQNNKFFQSLRIVLAFNPSDTAIGEIVLDIIENVFLEALSEDLEREPDEGKKEELRRLIGIWETYGDRRTPQGKTWSKEAVKVLTSVARRAGITSDMELQDMAAEITARAYGDWKAIINTLKNFNYYNGPEELIKLWKDIISKRTKDILRRTRQWRKREELPKSKETGEDLPIEDPKALLPGGVRDKDYDIIIDRMIDWVRRRVSGNRELLFDMWAALAKNQDNWKINWSGPIFKMYNEKTGNEYSQMMADIKRLKKLMVKFFEEELGIKMDKSTLRRLKLAERIAETYIRRQFAFWILEPYHTRRNLIADL